MIGLRTISTIFTAPLDFIYWIKWSIAYISIRIYNAFHRKRRFELYDVNAIGDPVKLGFVLPNLEKELESPFPESHLQEASDEVLFYGVNSKSECVLVRVARGCNQVADAWIHVKLADGKTYQLAESEGHQQPFEDGKCMNFSCGRLQMHYLSPMRRWRIFYCGMLKESSNENKSEKMVFVKLVFLWKASSNVYDLTLNSNSLGFVNGLARTKWAAPFLPPINNAVEATNFYAQSGVIHGTISINDGEECELYLFGEKMRNLGKTANIGGCTFTNIVGNIPKNGFTFHLGKASAPTIFENLSFGFIVQPDATLKAVQEMEINIQSDDTSSEKSITAIFKAGEQYELEGRVIGEPIVLSSGPKWRGSVEARFIEFTIGGKRKGSGLILAGELRRKQEKPIKCIDTTVFPKNVPLTIPFTNELCNLIGVSGGKGSSLGMLTKISSRHKLFIVPKGIVITTAAYQNFLTSEIRDAIKNLENVAYGNIKGDVKEACCLVSDVIVKTELPTKLNTCIKEELIKEFGNEAYQDRYAVRSSATGEDTAAMSAAGQMDTFLGVKGLEQIYLAVKKCWASQFSHTAIEYKKHYGQILNSPMAVVVQEMVSCEVSGVLFTCDPVTNNPSFITITANYGLGETVVSGSVEPDTFTLKRNVNGNLDFCSVNVGAKHQKLVMNESGGTQNEDVPESERGETCLTEEQAVRLGNISLKIEENYGSPRDIEWGIADNNIYILQSRPVTNIAAETEFEIIHELDSAMRCENEYYSLANVGEVMPGAASPLGIELIFKFFGNVLTRSAVMKGNTDNILSSKYFNSGMILFYNHLMVTAVEMMTRCGFDTPKSRGYMISVFGRILDDPDLVAFAREKCPPCDAPKQSFLQTIQAFRELFFFDRSLEKIKQKIWKYPLNFLKHGTASETFSALLKSCSDFDEAGQCHMDSSESSSEWNIYLFQILSDSKKGNLDIDVYGDFARLLANSSNVESANVPQSLQEVADQILKDIESESLNAMPVEEALSWLEKSASETGKKFRNFIKRHGHRCLKESDVRSVTWAMDPKNLVRLLQNLAGANKGKDKKSMEDYKKLFSELQVPLGFNSKCKLRFVLPNCRRAVRCREASKSLSMKSIDYWRQGFRHLAKQMVSEGRIPDEDLIFFFQLDEIKELFETRSPSNIVRAINRRKMFSKLNDYEFPELMRGMPRPINEKNETAETFKFVADLTMKGIPVSQGVTKGYARVAITLDEASHLKPGEILITFSTDIGWSPYFPIISGVVTELGGLISHGAVVSREYGLPCVVGLRGATKRFKTGDYVLLDGKKGILQRLPQPIK